MGTPSCSGVGRYGSWQRASCAHAPRPSRKAAPCQAIKCQENERGGVIATDQVLAVHEIHRLLDVYGGIDLGKQCRGNVDDRDTLVDGRRYHVPDVVDGAAIESNDNWVSIKGLVIFSTRRQ